MKEHKSFVEYKFDTQLLINIGEKDVDDTEDELREFILTKMVGDSLVIAGFEDEDADGDACNFLKVHFHTNEPWQLLAEAQTNFGDIYDVVVENMQRQADGLKG